jgi:hypothetical protein
MNISSQSVTAGWQSAIDGQTFGPAFHKAPDLWAWQQAVIQPQTLTPEQVAMLGAVLEYAINHSCNGENPPIFQLACELFHNLNLGE